MSEARANDVANILEARGITKVFGGLVAVNSVDFDIPERSIVSLIGPNGAGKTTLLNVLSGAVRLTSGRIFLGDRELTARKPDQIARMGVARTFQNLQIFASLSVLDNVLLPRIARSGWGVAVADMFGVAGARRRLADDRRAARDLLERVGIGEYADRPAGSLAYGLQRRVEIARALAGAPALLLLDEPFAGLTRSETTDLAELFTTITAAGVTVLLVEHDVASVLAVSGRVLVLDHGRLLADGTPDEVAAERSVRTAYLGEEWT
jgi:branched-chain amino acid transport system ATP-binding protein